MATWVRSGTGTAPTSTDAVLTGRYALDNGTAPGDFDAAGVTSVQIAYTITGTNFGASSDTWDDLRAATLDDATNTGASVNGTDNNGLANVGSSTDETDGTPNTGLSTAQWEAMAVSGGAGINGAYTNWNQDKGKDGGVQTMSALTVTITYTPAAAVVELVGAVEAASFNAADVDQIHKLVGTVESTAEDIATALQIHKPGGTLETVGFASGVLSIAQSVSGTVEAAAEVAGGGSQTHAAIGSVEAAADNTATPNQTHQLNATVEATAENTAVLSLIHTLTGAVEAVGDLTGTISLSRILAATVEAVSFTTATITQTISGVQTTKGFNGVSDAIVGSVALADVV